jgi:hypothetical protein
MNAIRETRELGTVRGCAGHSATPPHPARGQIAIQDAKRNFVPSCAAGVGGGVASLRVAGTTRPASRTVFTSFTSTLLCWLGITNTPRCMFIHEE